MTILKQESDTCRIVEKKTSIGWLIIRERLTAKRFLWFEIKVWRRDSYLFSGICNNVDDYVAHFDHEERQGNRFGQYQQFA